MCDKLNIIPNVLEYNAHIVPCKIHYTGEANTQDYFTPSKEIEELTESEICYYRGCKFLGKQLDMSNYTGYIMNKSESLIPGDSPDDYKVINTYTTIGKFNHLSLYGHNRLPKLTDAYYLVNQWAQISDAIHSDS